MELKNETELANTRSKLAELEVRYEELKASRADNVHARDATLRSLRRYINQFKEEIARFESRRSQNGQDARTRIPRGIQNDTELNNTLRKLRRLEELLESKRGEGVDDQLRRNERISLTRLINQFKEEIARYEAHQPAR